MDERTIARFWSKVDKSAGGDGCWIWTCNKTQSGYGRINTAGKQVRAHRVSWELANGPAPADACVCHRCDVRDCVNPSHLFLGTQAENSADRHAKGRSLRGEAHGFTKLNNHLVREIRRMRSDGVSIRSIARQIGVGSSAVSSVVLGKTWSHVDRAELAKAGGA